MIVKIEIKPVKSTEIKFPDYIITIEDNNPELIGGIFEKIMPIISPPVMYQPSPDET